MILVGLNVPKQKGAASVTVAEETCTIITRSKLSPKNVSVEAVCSQREQYGKSVFTS